jgi:transitional endoplasmic reticulum ATPase
VVFIEDIDNETSTGDTEKVSRLLEALDGATSKGSEIMLVVTTNHLDRIHKGMLRPGRFDAVIEIAALDAAGVERLIKAVVGDRKLDPDTDYAQVAKAMAGFFPAFVREAVDRARTLAITRHGRTYTLSTDELVAAAETLNAQLRAMEAATEGEPTPTLDATFRSIVRGSLDGYGWVRSEDDPIPDAYLMDPEKADLNAELRNT